MKKLVAAATIASAILLVSCSAQTEPVSPEPSADAAEPTPTLLDSQMEYCENLTHLLTPYQDVITAVFAEEPLNPTEWVELSSSLEALDPQGFGSGWENDHAAFMTMHDQIAESLAGGGSGILTSTDYKAGVVGVMDRCVDIGYSAAE